MTTDRAADEPAEPHVIRLRGPWQAEIAEHGSDAAARRLGRYQAPEGLQTLLAPGLAGRLRLRRSFHRPTGLTDDIRIELVIESTHVGTWSLNGEPSSPVRVGASSTAIQASLLPYNELCIEMEIDGSESMRQLKCDVRLEIYAEKE